MKWKFSNAEEGTAWAHLTAILLVIYLISTILTTILNGFGIPLIALDYLVLVLGCLCAISYLRLATGR